MNRLVIKISSLSASASLIFFACASKPLKSIQAPDSVSKITTGPNRVVIECELLENHNVGMILHVLEKSQTYLDLILSYQISPTDCDRRRGLIQKMMAHSNQVEIEGYGDLSSAPHSSQDPIKFSNLGKFRGDGRVLTFRQLRNEKGQCFTANHLISACE